MNATFFGHRNAPYTVSLELEVLLHDLIEHHKVYTYYVGNQGNFDYIVSEALEKMKVKYPQINYYVVLAYMPSAQKGAEMIDYSNTIYPERLENVPKRFAIPKRNIWMIEHSDIVITYVHHSFGGAAYYKEMAEKKGKLVINID